MLWTYRYLGYVGLYERTNATTNNFMYLSPETIISYRVTVFGTSPHSCKAKFHEAIIWFILTKYPLSSHMVKKLLNFKVVG